MKFIRYPFVLIWRVWFYVIMLLTVLLMSPILLIVTSHEHYYPYFYKVAHYWGKLIVFLMGFRIEFIVKPNLISGKRYMLTPNHMALIDVMVLLAIIPHNPFVFVGKIELTKIPIFGFFYKRSCIIVNRSDKNSRANVYTDANKKLEQGYSISIFPEGGVPEPNIMLDRFKDGAFRMAIEHQIPVVPISFLNFKEHMSWSFFSGGPGTLLVKAHEPIETATYSKKEISILKNQVRDIILNDLETYYNTNQAD